jgi:PIF1-like helicase/helix-turn-helix protein/HRDC domain-containing protein
MSENNSTEIIVDSSNEMFALAVKLIRQTSSNIFLTGKAGTGKTTFLKYIRQNCAKEIAVVAPTGVAAINAGAVTIHSFFQLPFAPFLPQSFNIKINNEEVVTPHSLLGRLRLTNEKRRILQSLELLIIDEVSMVRCDILDEIDLILRHYRHRLHEPFGGVQVLFIGDLFQLPPVVKEDEWKILSAFYESPFFFDSNVIKQNMPVYIEFKKIYRQNEAKFIHLLNQVRNNELTERGRSLLESRFQPAFRRSDHDDYIILTTHNDKARSINSAELTKLPGKFSVYEAVVEGDFSPSSYPANEQLEVKIGAHVMFIKNDQDRSKRYFNGKIGIVTELQDEKILVQCGSDPVIEVKREEWENIRYSLNKSTRRIEEEVLGSFSQFPLKLAWAITIHKSQGLTFEKAIIDAGEAFAAGQVYVALSRCTNIEGMILHSKVRPSSLFVDSRILAFSRQEEFNGDIQLHFEKAKRDHEQKVLESIFNFAIVVHETKELLNYVSHHHETFNDDSCKWIESVYGKLSSLQITAIKFQNQLNNLFVEHSETATNAELQARVKAASVYFVGQLEAICQTLLNCSIVTDSRIHAKEFTDSLKEIFQKVSLKIFLLQALVDGFTLEKYYEKKKQFVSTKSIGSVYSAHSNTTREKVETAHPKLYSELKKMRDAICNKKDLPVYLVASRRTLDEMTTFLPHTLEELKQISGFGPVRIRTYGNQFLQIIVDYCSKNNLTSNIAERDSKRIRKAMNGSKIDTKAVSLDLFKTGKTISEIATERKLAVSTIEGHLANFVQTGEIEIGKVIEKGKLLLIEPEIRNYMGGPITPIKEKLGDGISFSEIRYVIAWSEYQKSLAAHVNH